MTPPAAATARTAPARRTVAPVRPLRPSRPRRVSGPARPARGTAPGAAPSVRAPGLAAGALAALGALSRHRALDRLIAGKLWIGVVTFALIGIVTLQLGLLELNRGIGRALERESVLQRQNAALSVENSELAAGDKVETRAQTLGMELVPTASLRFLGSNPAADIARASKALQAPVQSVTPGNAERTPPSSQAAPASQSEPAQQQAPAGATASESQQSAPATSAESAGTEGPAQTAPAAPAGEPSPAGGTQASPSG